MMSEDDVIQQALREAGLRYIVDSHQRPLGFLLTPEEYNTYVKLRLSDDVVTQTRCEAELRYIVDSRQRPLGFLLTLEEYDAYIGMRHSDALKQTLREARPSYVVDSCQRPLGFLLTPEEYEDYINLLRLKAQRDVAPNDVTARLDQVYASESSSLDPVLLRLQLASVDEKPW